jgi:hypothetical protein
VVKAAKGDTGKVALDAKLVTALKTPLEVEKRIEALSSKDEENDSYVSVSLKDYLRVVRAEDKISRHPDARVAVLIGSGEIVDGGGGGGVIAGYSNQRALELLVEAGVPGLLAGLGVLLTAVRSGLRKGRGNGALALPCLAAVLLSPPSPFLLPARAALSRRAFVSPSRPVSILVL